VATLAASCVLLAIGCGGDGDGPSEAADVSTIEVVGPPETGSGEVPHFEWRAVDGIDEYGVVVRDPEGATIWAWRGEAVEIWFGGISRERPPGMAGPTVEHGSTWRVVGYDADGHLVAISGERSLDP
jgi:hypothetical protein